MSLSIVMLLVVFLDLLLIIFNGSLRDRL